MQSSARVAIVATLVAACCLLSADRLHFASAQPQDVMSFFASNFDFSNSSSILSLLAPLASHVLNPCKPEFAVGGTCGGYLNRYVGLLKGTMDGTYDANFLASVMAAGGATGIMDNETALDMLVIASAASESGDEVGQEAGMGDDATAQSAAAAAAAAAAAMMDPTIVQNALDEFCGACNKNDIVGVIRQLTNYFQENNPERNMTCAGVLPDLGILLTPDTVDLLLTAMCSPQDDSKSKSGTAYCMASAGTTLDTAGLSNVTSLVADDMMGELFTAIREGTPMTSPLMAIMRVLDIRRVCKSFNDAGCCAGNTLETTRLLLKMNCMEAESGYVNMMEGLCGMYGGFKSPCKSFTKAIAPFKNTAAAIKQECPKKNPLQEFIGFLTRDIIPIADTPYAYCTVPSGTCPKDECELYFCEVDFR